eukprot:PhM_4_TR4530/c0_g2_i1/m.61952
MHRGPVVEKLVDVLRTLKAPPFNAVKWVVVDPSAGRFTADIVGLVSHGSPDTLLKPCMKEVRKTLPCSPFPVTNTRRLLVATQESKDIDGRIILFANAKYAQDRFIFDPKTDDDIRTEARVALGGDVFAYSLALSRDVHMVARAVSQYLKSNVDDSAIPEDLYWQVVTEMYFEANPADKKKDPRSLTDPLLKFAGGLDQVQSPVLAKENLAASERAIEFRKMFA